MTENEIIRCGNIKNSEIQIDIDDTQKEINQYELELETLRRNPPENKMSIMSLEVKISKRKNFIKSLNEILNYRKEHK